MLLHTLTSQETAWEGSSYNKTSESCQLRGANRAAWSRNNPQHPPGPQWGCGDPPRQADPRLKAKPSSSQWAPQHWVHWCGVQGGLTPVWCPRRPYTGTVSKEAGGTPDKKHPPCATGQNKPSGSVNTEGQPCPALRRTELLICHHFYSKRRHACPGMGDNTGERGGAPPPFG